MRKMTRFLSLILVVCILFGMASSASASKGIINYENLFYFAITEDSAEISQQLLYAFIHDTRTFINELAFRDAISQEAVLYDLFSQYLILETLTTMEFMLNELNTIAVQSQFTKSEKALFNVLDFKITYEKYAFVQAYTDAPELFEEAMTLNEHQVESYAFQLAQTLKGDPKRFIVTLTAEEAEIQEAVFHYWQYISMSGVMAWVAMDILHMEETYAAQQASRYRDAEKETLERLINSVIPLVDVPFCIDPDPEELEQWLAQKNNPSLLPPDYVMEDDYDTLFSLTDDLPEVKFEKLYYAMLSDPTTFINELAFRDAEIKEYILDILAFDCDSYVKNAIMLELVSREMENGNKTNSEQALLEYAHYRFSYVKNQEIHPHRDCKKLFEEAQTLMSDGVGHYSEDFSYSLAQAFKADPKEFIVLLAQEDPEIQEFVAASLIYHPYDISLTYTVLEFLAREIDKANEQLDYYTKAEGDLVSLIRKKGQPIPTRPRPSDPDPKELEQWLLEKYPPVEIPTDIPVQTLPVTTPTEETEPRKEENSMPTAANDPSWISTVCFILAAFAAGIAVGGLLRKKPKEAAAQAPAAPAVTYPMRVYCPAPLEKETVEQITIALREKYQEYSIDWYSVKNPSGTCRCYGTDRGADIVFYAGGFRLEIPDSRTVAESAFRFGTAFELYLHKDGILTDLEEAYQNGLVSQDAIAAAAQMHNNTYKEDTL